MKPKTEISHITTPVAKYTLDFNTGVIKAKPIITQGDSMRSMADDELAEYLAPCACPPIRFNKNTGDIICPINKEPCESDCKRCWIDWLKKEVKND